MKFLADQRELCGLSGVLQGMGLPARNDQALVKLRIGIGGLVGYLAGLGAGDSLLSWVSSVPSWAGLTAAAVTGPVGALAGVALLSHRRLDRWLHRLLPEQRRVVQGGAFLGAALPLAAIPVWDVFSATMAALVGLPVGAASGLGVAKLLRSSSPPPSLRRR